MPENEKKPTYILRCDGTLDLYLRGGPNWWTQAMEQKQGDIILPAPIKKAR